MARDLGDPLEEVRSFMKSRVILTASQLDLFTLLDQTPVSAQTLAQTTGTDLRALTRLLDCLVTFDYLTKANGIYALTDKGAQFSSKNPESVLPMVLHLAHIWHNWHHLTETVRQGSNPHRQSVVHSGPEALAAFIGAMHVVGKNLARDIAASLNLSPFKQLLDIGGASGTYTIAFLERNPSLRAVLFDLPEVLPMAQERLHAHNLLDRVRLVAGDFYVDPLPTGCDLVLLSAIIHQNSPEQNVALYRKIRDVLEPGGCLLIRDHIMEPDRIHPPAGALFAINMLVNTEGGDTYTFEETKAALHEAGFRNVAFVRKGLQMDCLVQAFV
ncbi:methyltransferase [Desulfosoma caldarium]|uniref:Methyltransferase family protein n=1 Tax=Desulfosoma caldarium TaxID=610254 RepID=A0A3N1VKI2_9BACT|nr:methyltransferase [Desulfosoma caldarium]ROR01498.1 methyltransferase family protein [Desulfosoma caldarium]